MFKIRSVVAAAVIAELLLPRSVSRIANRRATRYLISPCEETIEFAGSFSVIGRITSVPEEKVYRNILALGTSFSAAIDTAEYSLDARALYAEIGQRRGRLVFNLAVVSGNGSITKLQVDAVEGRVLQSDRSDRARRARSRLPPECPASAQPYDSVK